MNFIVKWWPIVSTIIGLIGGMLGTHNNAALLAGSSEPSIGGAPLAVGGVLMVVLGAFGYLRNHGAASNSLPPSSVPNATTEDQLLGLLAQTFASKRDSRIDKISTLFAKGGGQ